MTLLLDTHVLLWAHASPDRLGSARALVEDPANRLLVSAASAWEIAIKAGLGRLRLPEPVATWMPSRTADLGAESLAIEAEHATAVADLPPVHRDPFDRMLVAQAKVLGATLLTADAILEEYEADVVLIR